MINRANDRRCLFSQEADYKEFLDLLLQACERIVMRLCAFCLMPNHWHLVLWPTTEGDISRFMHWLSSVHAMRVRRRWNTVGSGHVYQDRYKSFPVQTGIYYRNVVTYVEANPVRAGLVDRPEDWEWSSFTDRSSDRPRITLASPMALALPGLSVVSDIELSTDELEALRHSAEAGRPYGSPAWSTAFECRRRRTRPAGLAP